ETSIVETNCHISNQSKAMIILKSAEAQSIKSLSRDCSVSWHTAQREIDKAAQSIEHHHYALPENLSFDEFKYAKGLMAFEYINAETGDILDILEERTSRVIKNHFIANYSLNDRRLKRYWKLILKNEMKLSSTKYKYYALFGQRLEKSIIEEMLNYDS